ncbi:5-hydroxytryptamine receptor 1A-alpha-like [Paramacrobiotus metropolitanus]|uniref:5-hydroxytryptamine receptor 1A-alpha-like n=1 Tax=Paramacrobiotus metropolitanus TaxID=2943436 RepID=UPI002445F9A3|nr:5-hydroxytryptamine receptor 1A-alpha-like [Paramacrobiotus metropolitanus]
MTFMFLTFFPNAFLLGFFAFHRHLITPFTVYIISLLISNILVNNICMLPYAIVEHFSIPQDLKTAFAIDVLYSYGGDVIMGVVMFSHCAITLNRLWAVYFPVHYRQRHSKKTAGIFCSAIWLIIHTFTLPIALNRHSYQLFGIPSRESINDLYTNIVGPVVYIFPVCFVAVAYPFMFRKTSQRWRESNTMETVTEGISRTLSFGWPERY